MFQRLGFQMGTTAMMALPLIVLPVIVANSGAVEDLGVLAVAITIASLLTAFMEFGSFLLLSTHVARDSANSALKASFRLSLMVARLLVIVAILLILISASGVASLLPFGLATLGVAVSSPARVVRGMLHGRQQFAQDMALSAIQEVSFTVGGAFVYHLTGSVTGLFVAFVGTRILGAAVAWKLIKTEFAKAAEDLSVRPEWTVSLVGTACKARPYLLNGLLSIVYLRSDVLLLALIGTTADVAIYEAGALLIVRGTVLIQLLTTVALPPLSRLFPNSTELPAVAGGLGHAALLMGLLVALPIVLLDDFIVRTLFGEAFDSSSQVLAVLSFLIPAKFVSNAVATVLTACEQQVIRTRAVALAGGLNIALNLLFIPTFGLWAAVWSTVAAELVLLSFLTWHVTKIREHVMSRLQATAGATVFLSLGGVLSIGLTEGRVAVGLLGGAAVALLVGRVRPTVNVLRAAL